MASRRVLALRLALSALLPALLLGGCGREELLHGLDEPRANEVLVALGEGGIEARQVRDDGAEPAFTVDVAAPDAARARRLLADRALPRERAPGFAEVFQKASMIPTPTEEHALFQHALAGELARSVEAIDGVVGARVHLGLPPPDPLRTGERPPARAAVLVRCRPAACDAVRALEPGLRALVAGAADGLDPGAVSVVITPAAPALAPVAPEGPRRAVLLALAAAAAVGAAALGVAGWRARRDPSAGRAPDAALPAPAPVRK